MGIYPEGNMLRVKIKLRNAWAYTWEGLYFQDFMVYYDSTISFRDYTL